MKNQEQQKAKLKNMILEAQDLSMRVDALLEWPTSENLLTAQNLNNQFIELSDEIQVLQEELEAGADVARDRLCRLRVSIFSLVFDGWVIARATRDPKDWVDGLLIAAIIACTIRSAVINFRIHKEVTK